MPDRTRRGAALVAFTLLFVTAGMARSAGADWPVPRGPSHEPVPYRFDREQVKQLPRESLEDAPAVYLYSGTSYLVDADGTTEMIGHEVIRLNGRRGIELFGEYRGILYEPNYQKLTLNEARVHKADGQVIALAPRHIRLRDTNTDYAVYDHDKQLIISFPELEVGDCIEAKWTIRGRNPEFQGQFFYRHTFGNDTCPVAREELRVRLPEAKPLKYAVVAGKVEPEVRHEDGLRTYLWQVQNTKTLPKDDNLPSAEELRLQVELSTFTSWKEVEDWNRHLLTECWQCTPKIHKLVEEIIRDQKTPEDKARALTHWVRRHIRYVSAASAGERHDFTPHPPGLVLSHRSGDCKDGSQLLAVMLKDAGIPAGLVTLNTADAGQIDESVPSPAGNHAIVLVPIDGKDHWIDTTVARCGWDFLPTDDRNRVCYVIDEKSLRVLRTPPMTADDNRYEQTTEVYVHTSGLSHCERSAAYSGLAAWAQRESWVEAPAGERRRLVVADLQNASDQPHLTKLTIDEVRLANYDLPATARLEYDSTTFNGLAGTLRDPILWPRLLATTVDPDRQVALVLGKQFESIHHFVLHLPAGHRISLPPEDYETKSPWGSLEIKVKKSDEDPWRLEITFHTRLDKVRVEPGELEEFRKFQKDVDDHCLQLLTADATKELTDAPTLEKTLQKTPEDADAAQVLAELYLKNNKWEEARRVLQKAIQASPKVDELSQLMIQVTDAMQAQATLDRGKAYYQLAENASARGDFEDALKSFDKAGEANPESIKTPAAWEFKARQLEKLGRGKDAVAAYREVLAQRPEDHHALAALVSLSLTLGDRAAALDYLRKFTLLASDADLQVQAADFHLRLERYDDALDLAERAHKASPTGQSNQVLGLVALHRDDTDKALEYLEAARKQQEEDKEPLDVRLLAGLVQVHVARGELREVEPLAKQLRDRGEEAGDLKTLLEVVDALQGRRVALSKAQPAPQGKAAAWDKALDRFVCAERQRLLGRSAAQVEGLLKAALADDLDFGPALGLRGLLLVERGRLTEALADADRAVVLCPTEASGFYVRGRVRLERGGEGSLPDLQKAAELSQRKDGAVLHWLAVAQFRAGQLPEAIKTQREAVELRPEDSEYAEQLKRFEREGESR